MYHGVGKLVFKNFDCEFSPVVILTESRTHPRIQPGIEVRVGVNLTCHSVILLHVTLSPSWLFLGNT